ncbi:MAG: glycosyltransferase family 4 protein [Bacteroidales bacterium]|nr:glycosyltransferase family 4 protein [Bacteroidales bacterium]
MKKIWIVNYYAGTPQTAANPRYLHFAKRFMDAGYEVTTFNASNRVGLTAEDFKGQPFLKKQYGIYKFVHVAVPEYQGNGVKRMYSIWSFAHSIFKLRDQFEKPDVILHNIHPPFDYPIVRMAKKLKARYITEAWDLWPNDFVTYGLVKENNPAMKIAYQIEKQYYYHADEIVFTFEGALDYLRKKGWTKEKGGQIDMKHVHYVNNGIDLKQFDADKERYPREDADINNQDLYKIVYLGAINRANNVKTLIQAAALLKDNPNYRFFLYGDGAYREELEAYAQQKGLSNIVFKEKKVSFAECAWIVSQATVNVMNYERDFGKYGVSSGKLFLYLAAGKPIVCNINIAYDDVISEHNLGFAHDMESPEEMAQAICQLAEQPEGEYKAMCKRVRQVAEKFDYEYLSTEELKIVE